MRKLFTCIFHHDFVCFIFFLHFHYSNVELRLPPKPTTTPTPYIFTTVKPRNRNKSQQQQHHQHKTQHESKGNGKDTVGPNQILSLDAAEKSEGREKIFLSFFFRLHVLLSEKLYNFVLSVSQFLFFVSISLLIIVIFFIRMKAEDEN
jgi:hypothetical protein